MKRIEELREQNRIITQQVQIAQDRGEHQRGIDLKRELYRNKLEMLDIIEGVDEAGAVTIGEAILAYESMPVKPKYETGIIAIDEPFDGGIELANLVMIGGEKGAGKTAFAFQFLSNVSQGFQTLFVSLEMPTWKVAKRAKLLRMGEKQLRNMKITDRGRDIEDVEKLVRAEAKGGTKFVVIDSLMKIGNSRLAGKRNEQISDITSRLARLAVELEITIILIVQVSKEDLKAGHMAIKGSGDADYDADIMFFIKRAKDDELKREFICEKNRQNGNEFKCEMYLNRQNVTLTTDRTLAAMSAPVHEYKPEQKQAI